MATVNNRVFMPQATVINGVSVGGATTVRISAGFENIIRSSPDGLQLPTVDRDCQYVRGTVVIEDWPDAVGLITGTVGTMVFYERKSGVVAATGYTKHTITAPVIHNIRLALTKGGNAILTFDFECRFASETATINDVWVPTDSQAAPTYLPAARGGWRIVSALFNSATSIYHLMSFSFNLTIPVIKECNDSDVGYTAVDALPEVGMSATGSLGFQDAAIAADQLLVNTLLVASRASLVITARQSGGAADKVITLANVQFGAGDVSGAGRTPDAFTLNFEIANDPSVPLTLAGDNKIITIADAA